MADFDQDTLTAAIVAAIKQGFVDAKEEQKDDPIIPPKPTNNDPTTGGDKSGGKKDSSLEWDTVKGVTNTATGVAGSFAGAIAESGKAALDYISDQNDGIERTLGYLYNIQDAYGGVTEAQLRAGETGEGMVKHSIESAEHLLLVAAGQKENALEIQSGALAGSNAMRMVFKDFVEASNYYQNVLVEIGNVSANTAKSVESLGQAELERIAIIGKRMEISDIEMSTMLQRQYAFTGEASSKVFEDIASVSTELAKTTGGSANQLKGTMLDVMQDTHTFGDIGVKAAGRIAGALNQLGVDFNTFQQITKNFMNFETAAGKMGELSAMFGIQMDAMEMTYLANEDQEEFLFKLREDLLDSGVDIENMSKSRQRFLADQVGLSVTQLQTFMREGEMMADQDDMFAATEAAEDIDGLATAIDSFGGKFEGATKNAEDFAKELRVGMVIPVKQDLLELKNAGQDAIGAISPQVPEEAIENMRKTVSAEVAAIESQTANIKVGVEFLNEAAGGGANFLNKLLEGGGFGEGDLDNKVQVDAVHEVAIGADELTKTQLSNLSIELGKQQERDAISKDNVEKLLTQQGLNKEVIDKILSDLASQKEVKIAIDLNADQIGDKIFKVKESKQGGKFVFVEE